MLHRADLHSGRDLADIRATDINGLAQQGAICVQRCARRNSLSPTIFAHDIGAVEYLCEVFELRLHENRSQRAPLRKYAIYFSLSRYTSTKTGCPRIGSKRISLASS